MKETMILIHGTWGTSDDWRWIRGDFEQMGYNVLVPDLLGHDLPYDEAYDKVGDIDLLDYVEQILGYVDQCPSPPILVGHSLGGLIAQKVAEAGEVAGLILLGTAPTWDIFALYPRMIQCFLPHYLRWGFWRKPMPPYLKALQICYNQHSEEVAERVYQTSVPESGRVYAQMGLSKLDPRQTTRVDFEQIQCPVLVLTGQNDQMVHPNISVQTARNYGDQATLILSGEADHMYISQKFKNQTVEIIQHWLRKEGFRKP